MQRSLGPGNTTSLQSRCPLNTEILPTRPLGLPGPAANVSGLKERPQAGRLERLPHAPCAQHGPALHLVLQSRTGFTAVPVLSRSSASGKALMHYTSTLYLAMRVFTLDWGFIFEAPH